MLQFDVHQAFQVTEGQLSLEIEGEQISLIFGDLAFVPKGVKLQYWSEVEFTKVVNWVGGGSGFADKLIDDSEPWSYGMWPVRDLGKSTLTKNELKE